MVKIPSEPRTEFWKMSYRKNSDLCGVGVGGQRQDMEAILKGMRKRLSRSGLALCDSSGANKRSIKQ